MPVNMLTGNLAAESFRLLASFFRVIFLSKPPARNPLTARRELSGGRGSVQGGAASLSAV
eukprot:290016-Pleurochrysis_carterae.AAC.5